MAVGSGCGEKGEGRKGGRRGEARMRYGGVMAAGPGSRYQVMNVNEYHPVGWGRGQAGEARCLAV